MYAETLIDTLPVEVANSDLFDLLDLVASLRPAWWKRAACRRPENAHVDFFPEEMHNKYAYAPAKAVCAKCPVRKDCYQEHVLDNYESAGVWAGFTQQMAQVERKRVGIKLTRGGYGPTPT